MKFKMCFFVDNGIYELGNGTF